MKKIGLLAGLLCFSLGIAQKKEYIPLQTLKANAEKAALKFVEQLDSEINFSKYYKLNEEESTIVGNFPFSELKSAAFQQDNVIGYILNFALKKEYYPIPGADNLNFSLYINRDFEVDYSKQWNSSWSRAVSGNLEVNYDNLPKERDKEFIKAQLNFINRLKEGKVHSIAAIKSYLKSNYSNKTFRDVKISRLSYPPYRVYFSVMENNCSECIKLEIPVDSFEGIDTSNVSVRELR